ncbi:hypothetical protein BY458DRAFT_510461 [Sporodiniella umbellata]|nr:hypothetical protein BY458DRAFT_510461 [Sporodiniella umbellata]
MNNNSLPLENVTVKAPADKTRRKRLKVISACCECRRKKTKCNGEKPCIGCIKTNLDCRYASNNNPSTNQQHIIKTKHNQRLGPSHANSASAMAAKKNNPSLSHPPPSHPASSHPTHIPHTHHATTTTTTTNTTTTALAFSTTAEINKATLHSIEHRLGAIEEILQLLLQQQQQQQQQQQPSEPRLSGLPHRKRKHDDMKDYVRLPPPLNYPESSSSSVSSNNTSPKLNTIQNLLNEEKNQKRSAFYRMTAGSDLRPTSIYY